MNFGRRIPGQETKPKIVREKKGVTSDNVLREINLFIPELIAVVVSVLGFVLVSFFARLMMLSSLETLKAQMLNETYVALTSSLNTASYVFFFAGLIPVGLFAIFFLIRFTMFMPKKNRFLFLRIYDSGAIKLSVEELKPEVGFSNALDSIKMTISNPRKHFDLANGKPFIVLKEGDDSNADLNIGKNHTSDKGVATSVVNDNAIALGRRIERYIAEQKGGFLSTTNILILIVIFVVVIIGARLFFGGM